MRDRGSDPLPKMARTLFGECPGTTITSYSNANRNSLYISFTLTLRELSLAGYRSLQALQETEITRVLSSSFDY